jgi:hypothetical protein
MSITEINKSISKFGMGLLAKIKYGISFSYNRYDYLSSRIEKQEYLQSKTYQTIYKKISK